MGDPGRRRPRSGHWPAAPDQPDAPHQARGRGRPGPLAGRGGRWSAGWLRRDVRRLAGAVVRDALARLVAQDGPRAPPVHRPPGRAGARVDHPPQAAVGGSRPLIRPLAQERRSGRQAAQGIIGSTGPRCRALGAGPGGQVALDPLQPGRRGVTTDAGEGRHPAAHAGRRASPSRADHRAGSGVRAVLPYGRGERRPPRRAVHAAVQRRRCRPAAGDDRPGDRPRPGRTG